MRRLASSLAVLLFVPPSLCASDLFLDLRTDYAPGADFSRVRVQLLDRSDERRSWHTITSASGGDFLSGERIAEFADVDRGRYIISVEILDGRMRTVHGRIWLFEMGGRDRGAILLIVRP